MSEAPLKHEYEYFPDPTRGRPVSSGSVYVGVANLDPTILANRVDVVLIQQNGTRVIIAPASQPFQTTPGGVIEYQGSPANIRVSGTVSITVQDSVGDTVFYNPLANQHLSTSGTGTNAGGVPLNGNFEIETVPGTPDNWALVPASNATIAVDNTTQSSGFKSLNFTSTSAAGAGRATSDKFDVEDGGQNDIRFSLKSTSINVLNTIDIIYYDASDNTVSLSTVFSEGANNPLTFASFLVTDLAPATAVQCEIVLYGVSSLGAVTTATTWFDNVSLTNLTGTYEVGVTGEVIQTSLAANSVNQIRAESGAAGNGVGFTATGDDADVDFNLSSQGAGDVNITSPSGNVNIDSPSGDVNVNGKAVSTKEIVILDVPELLVTTSTTTGFLTHDSPTLGAAGATVAILKFSIETIGTSSFGSVFGHLRKTGTATTDIDATKVVQVGHSDATNTYASSTNTTHVNLDVNSDFDYYGAFTGGLTTAELKIFLVGYYV